MSMLVSLWIATGVCIVIALLWLGVLFFANRRVSPALGYTWLLWVTLSYAVLCITIGETVASLLVLPPDTPHIVQTVAYGVYYTVCAAIGYWVWKKCVPD